MDPSDSASRLRRKIPSVTDLVDELSRRLKVTAADQPLLFQAAQQVCAEELKLVRTGFVPGRLEDLVERARKLLPASLAAADPLSDEWSERAPFGEGGARPLAAPRAEPGGPFDWSPETELPVSGSPPPFSIYSEESPADRRPIEPLALPSSVAANSTYVKTPSSRSKAEPMIFRFMHDHRPGRFGTALVIVLGAAALAVGLSFVRLPRVGRIADRFSGPEESTLRKSLLAPIFRAIKPKPKSESAPPAPSRTEVFAPQTSAPAPTEPAPIAAKAARPAAAAKPAAPAPKSSRPIPAPAPPSAPVPSASPAPALPVSSPGSMISPEWSGKASGYVLHFTSFQKEENARRDAARISKLVGRDATVLSVNLGKEGLWFRVVVGPFPTKDAAIAYREDLARKGTPDMGLVYRAQSPK